MIPITRRIIDHLRAMFLSHIKPVSWEMWFWFKPDNRRRVILWNFLMYFCILLFSVVLSISSIFKCSNTLEDKDLLASQRSSPKNQLVCLLCCSLAVPPLKCIGYLVWGFWYDCHFQMVRLIRLYLHGWSFNPCGSLVADDYLNVFTGDIRAFVVPPWINSPCFDGLSPVLRIVGTTMPSAIPFLVSKTHDSSLSSAQCNTCWLGLPSSVNGEITG